MLGAHVTHPAMPAQPLASTTNTRRAGHTATAAARLVCYAMHSTGVHVRSCALCCLGPELAIAGLRPAYARWAATSAHLGRMVQTQLHWPALGPALLGLCTSTRNQLPSVLDTFRGWSDYL